MSSDDSMLPHPRGRHYPLPKWGGRDRQKREDDGGPLCRPRASCSGRGLVGPAVDPELGLLPGLRWRGGSAADPTQALRGQPSSNLSLRPLPVGLARTALPREDTPADHGPPWPPPKAHPALCSRSTGSRSPSRPPHWTKPQSPVAFSDPKPTKPPPELVPRGALRQPGPGWPLTVSQ